MKTYSVNRGDSVEEIQAETCTPTANGDLVFFTLAGDGKPQLFKVIASGHWTEVDAKSTAIIV